MTDTTPALPDPIAAPIADDPSLRPVRVADRATPGWARWLGAIFAISAFAAALGVATSTVFLLQSAESGADFVGAGLISAVAAIPALGIAVIHAAHARALGGFRRARERIWYAVQAVAGAAIVVFLAILHPLLATAPLLPALLFGGVLTLLARHGRLEPAWDFRPEEAAAFFSGRDEFGLSLARRPVDEHPLAPGLHGAAVWLALLATTALASVLVAREVLAPEALLALVLIGGLAPHAMLRGLREVLKPDPFVATGVAEVMSPADIDPAIAEKEAFGLHVQGVSVATRRGRALLSEVSFDAQPGTMTALIGESGVGKSVLMRTMTDPFSLLDCTVRGRVTVNGTDLWRRRPEDHAALAVRHGPHPILLPVSGAENLACFQTGAALERGKAALHQLVFSTDLVEEICEASDATRLPAMQQRALCLARAFVIAPQVYLLDQPEDGLPEKQVGALLNRLRQELRMGRIILIATENRQLLEACDRIVVMQGGRVVDYGEADETRARLDTGWRRFVGRRQLEIEDSLHSWIRSHFKRDGDEGNRRTVATIASEMLAFSCIGASPNRSDRLVFELKHHQGYCLLRMIDEGEPVTSATRQMARDLAETADPGKRLPPLATLYRDTLGVEFSQDGATRCMTVKIETYDPRLTGARDEAPHAADAG